MIWKSVFISLVLTTIFLHGCQAMAMVHSSPKYHPHEVSPRDQDPEEDRNQVQQQTQFLAALKSALLGMLQEKMAQPPPLPEISAEPTLCVDVYGINDCSVASAVRGRRYFMMMH